MRMAVEEWRPVPGFEETYEVSNQGRVRNRKRGTVLKPRLKKGYNQSALHKNNRYTHVGVHRLVAMAFHGPPPEGKPLALHKNGRPLDNRPENLYWGDYTENMQDRFKHGTDNRTLTTECRNGHKYTTENTYWSKHEHRSCQACRREHTRKQNQRRKEEARGRKDQEHLRNH